jgi:hypothetical protein
MSKERKPDLATDNYGELEARVEKMMSDNLADGTGVLPSAPDLPMDGKKLDIKIVRDEDSTEDEQDDSAIPEFKVIRGDDAPESAESELDEPKPAESDTTTEVDPQPKDEVATDFDNQETEAAVQDIVSNESDTVLQSQDDIRQKIAHPPRQRVTTRFRLWLVDLWRNRTKRRVVIGLILLTLFIIGIVPMTRYFVLNLVGVRSSMSVTVLDDSSLQPLRNVTVKIGNVEAKTNERGYATLDNLRLGKQDLVIERRAFANRTLGITIGWGSNPLGDYQLFPTGSQYIFVFEDFLSGKALEGAEVIRGDVSAFADEEGLARLTIDAENDAPEIDVTFSLDGYREDSVSIDANTSDNQVIKLTPARKHFFMSTRNDQKDVYSIDADGQNESLVLEATGSERDDMTLHAHPNRDRLAVMSTRDNARNQDGFLLSSLTIIDLDDDQTITIAQSERIQIIQWFDNRIVYVQIAQGASGTNPGRHRLISYDYENDEKTELASSNYFNSVTAVGEYIYYAPSSIFQLSPTSFYRIKADGTDKKTVLENESWSVYRSSFNTLTIATSSRWYTYDIQADTSESIEGEPADLTSRLYVTSPDGSHNARIDERDGKGVILIRNGESGDETVLHEAGGLEYPLRWLNNSTIVYRMQTAQETADYVLSTDGGNPVKLKDVTATSGIERWYYY